MTFNLIFLATSLWITSTIAQDGLNSTAPRFCPRNIQKYDSNAPVNSTGNIRFPSLDNQDDREWQLSVTFNDTRDEVLVSSMHDLQAWLSTPSGTNQHICISMFNSLNREPGLGKFGCEGVLSDVCIEYMETHIGSADASRCPHIRLFMDDLEKHCGRAMSTASVSSGAPFDLSNNTCTIDRPPGGVELSDIAGDAEYRTWAGIGLGKAPSTSDKDASDFTWYDHYVRAPIPIVITTSSAGTNRTKVVCVAPSRVQEGSRVPPGWETVDNVEGENDGLRTKAGSMGAWVAVGVTLILSFVVS